MFHWLNSGRQDHPAQPRREGRPIVPLIAETGGINAMLVDSTALPEHVADAVVQSAFRSAGQRCSALRLFFVHEEIADHVVTMLRGAMNELVVGDTASLATDVGPLIDQEAFDGIRAHVERLGGHPAGAALPRPDSGLSDGRGGAALQPGHRQGQPHHRARIVWRSTASRR